jgi:hypothetical protein
VPIAKYNRFFGGDAAKALAALKKQYGTEKGRRVFYALVNKRRR